MLRFLALSLLLATPAVAAPFDLAELREQHPGAELLIFEQSLVVERVDDRLRLTSERRAGLLQEGARDDLRMYTTVHRPGCREVVEAEVQVTPLRGEVQTLTKDDLLESIESIHPTNPEKTTHRFSGPRRGLGAGAELWEREVIDYPMGCFGGLAATDRSLGHSKAVILRDTIEVRCAGDGCFAKLDRDAGAEWEPAEPGVRLVRTDVRPPPNEARTPGDRWPNLLLSTSDDPLALAKLLAGPLQDSLPAARSRVAGYARDAKDDLPNHVDPAERMSRYLRQKVPRLTSSASWTFGADFGAVPRAGDRGVSPLEWWSLAVAALEPYGGVPVLYDHSDDQLPPDGVAKVVGFREFGVLLPHALVTPRRWVRLHGGTSNSLANRHLVVVDADAPTLRTFEGSAEGWRDSSTAVVDAVPGDYTRIQMDTTYHGIRAVTHGVSWDVNTRAEAKKKAKKRRAESERQRAFVAGKFGVGAIATGEVVVDKKNPESLTLKASYSRPSEGLRGEGVKAATYPLPWSFPLRDLVLSTPREAPIRLEQQARDVEVVFRTPEGYSLAGLPPGGEAKAEDGSVAVTVAWSEVEGGAKLTIGYRVHEIQLAPEQAEVVNRAAELLRAVHRPTLLYLEAP